MANGTMKTLAFQIPEELDQRIKNYLAAEKERTGKKLSQREFVVGLIVEALDRYDTQLVVDAEETE